MKTILDDWWVQKYFGCGCFDGMNPALCHSSMTLAKESMALRVIEAMHAPIEHGEEYLNSYFGCEWDKKTAEQDLGLTDFHPHSLRLHDHFQKQEEKKECPSCHGYCCSCCKYQEKIKRIVLEESDELRDTFQRKGRP